MANTVPVPDFVQEALKEDSTITSLPLQWGDMDAFGHVNNVVYIRWFESARIDLLNTFSSVVSMEPGGVGPILASVKCDYKKQLHFPDTVHVGTRVGEIGRTSATAEHTVYSEKLRAVAATGTSTLVVFDYNANRPIRVPEDLRSAMQAAQSSQR